MKLLDILESTRIPAGYRMAFVVNFFREPNMRRMERETGLIRPELTVLICLNHKQGLHARDICEITEQPSNTVSRAVNALLGKGLITSTRDPVDTRRNLLGLTDEGQRLHDRVMEMFAETEARMLEALTEEERAMLIHLLDKLARDVARWSPGAS